MNVCLIYSGWFRTWEQCRGNHAERLTPAPAHVVHYNETTPFEDEPFTVDEWGYDANKAGENEAWNTMNMWRAMWRAWELAPQGFDVYVRMRYDIIFDGIIDFTQFDYPPNRVYIPDGNDYRDGVNDQMAIGSWEAMHAYHAVYLDHPEHFAAGKMFHSESYLKYTLDKRGINIVRIPVRNSIVRP